MPAHAGRRLAALGVTVVALMSVPPLQTAHSRVACSCAAPADPQEYDQQRFEQADVVFSGRVLSERVDRVPHYSADGTGVSYSGTVTYRIEPDRVYKGFVRSPQRVRGGGVGSSCEFRAPSRSATKGRFLFFAEYPTPKQAAKFKARGAKPPVFTGLCSGNQKLEPGQVPPYGAGRPVDKS